MSHVAPQMPLPPALNSLPPIRWDRVADARMKIARGDYDRLADTELAAELAAAVIARFQRPAAAVPADSELDYATGT